MTVAFELDGQGVTALNGGPMFKFNEAISFEVNCETQEEVDHYWGELSKAGDERRKCAAGSRTSTAFPANRSEDVLIEMINHPDSEKSGSVTEAYFK
jgi:hypothetical protein